MESFFRCSRATWHQAYDQAQKDIMTRGTNNNNNGQGWAELPKHVPLPGIDAIFWDQANSA